MRITGGEFGGRNLKVPKSDAIRPTQDRVREALFNIIQCEIADADFLDLFAGSGAVGLEALSRGAKSVTFVERERRHLAVLKENVLASAGPRGRGRYDVVAAVSVGVCEGVPTLDLDYIHDSSAEVDLNVIMTDRGKFVELQGCAEHKAFSDKDLAAMIRLAKKGLKKLFALQKKALKK